MYPKIEIRFFERIRRIRVSQVYRVSDTDTIRVRDYFGVSVQHRWLQTFPGVVVEHFCTYSSDHMALVLKLNCVRRGNGKVFRFERMWLREEAFHEIVKNVWIDEELKDLKKNMETIQQQVITEAVIQSEERLSAEIDEWLQREEILWQQRSRVNWLEEGDSNTKFFHAYATSRRKRNFINQLLKSDGTTCTDRSEIQNEIVSYFKHLYAADNQASVSEMTSKLQCVRPKVTRIHNDILATPYTANEVTKAVFQLHPLKAPGKDGFSAAFIQNCWHVVKDHFIANCLMFLNDGILSDKANITLTTLIPKQKQAVRISDYRPISLIGVKEKVLSKVIANRLQQVLLEIISDEQCAFVQNRLITDNIMIAQEVSHYIHNIRNQKAVYGSIKLDVAKAYDRVSWTYLSHIMLRLGFEEICVRRIMQLVTSVKYSVRVNDEYTDYIVPQRGLRQGDPLSPYLFIICTEGFSALINHYKLRGLIDGIKICRRAPVVSHLLFADDSLIFMKITDHSIRHVKALLSEYEYISGQSINYHKSEAVLSRNAPEHVIAAFESVLGVKLVQKHCKYLGVPLLLNRKRSDTFQSLLDKLWSKTQGWKNRLLSVIRKIHAIVSNFWWQQTGDRKAVHWIRADILRTPKEEGGLDFVNFKCLNKALLAKQCWRIVNNEHLLEEKKGGIGVVLRDHTGVVLGINALHVNHVNSIEDAEGTALWEGMKLAESLKLEKVIFEVDNKEVTMAVNYCVKEGVWTSDWLIASSRFLESHREWKVVLVRREANMAADTIAKKANMEEWCWRKLDSLPYICHFVQLL
ncbi:hypothetical protein QQ045_006307 [Rhodiola kirilowii]